MRTDVARAEGGVGCSRDGITPIWQGPCAWLIHCDQVTQSGSPAAKGLSQTKWRSNLTMCIWGHGRLLMRQAAAFIEAGNDRKKQLDARDVLDKAHQRTKRRPGSTTVCIGLMLPGGTLQVTHAWQDGGLIEAVVWLVCSQV